MRTRQNRKTDYAAISRRSMQRDFNRVQVHTQTAKRPQIENLPEIKSEKRILFVGEQSTYYKYRSYLIGRLVRLVDKSNLVNGWICEFVHDDDSIALNKAAGWSNAKKRYLLDGVKFKT